MNFGVLNQLTDISYRENNRAIAMCKSFYTLQLVCNHNTHELSSDTRSITKIQEASESIFMHFLHTKESGTCNRKGPK